MCLYPQMIKNKRYTSTIKRPHGSLNDCTDHRKTKILINCGKCEECLKKRGRQWAIRLLEENKNPTAKGYFVTMTIDDENIKHLEKETFKRLERTKDKMGFKKYSKKQIWEMYQDDNEIATTAVRLFLERWRKKYKHSVKHWFINERGHKGTQRMHLHGIIWQDDIYIQPTKYRQGRRNKSNDEFSKTWGYGYVFTGHKCNEQTASYIVKYITKIDEKRKDFVPKILTSPGLGKQYLNETRKRYLRERWVHDQKISYKYENGTECSLPIYYKNHTWNEEERDEIWTITLNKNKLFYKDNEYNTKNPEEIKNYVKALEFASKRSHIKNRKKINYNYEKLKKDIIFTFTTNKALIKNNLKYLNYEKATELFYGRSD